MHAYMHRTYIHTYIQQHTVIMSVPSKLEYTYIHTYMHACIDAQNIHTYIKHTYIHTTAYGDHECPIST